VAPLTVFLPLSKAFGSLRNDTTSLKTFKEIFRSYKGEFKGFEKLLESFH
jgi:hypothetical protein